MSTFFVKLELNSDSIFMSFETQTYDAITGEAATVPDDRLEECLPITSVFRYYDQTILFLTRVSFS